MEPSKAVEAPNPGSSQVASSPGQSGKPWALYLTLGALAWGVSEWYVVSHFSDFTEAWKKVTLGTELKHAQKSLWTAFNGKKGIWRSLFESIQAKVDRLEKLDQEVAQLRLENEKLRMQLATARFQAASAQNQQTFASYEKNLKAETGAVNGRTPASIPYQVPQQLEAGHLYTLALGYLRAKEYEKAGKILGDLLSREDDKSLNTLKTPQNFLTAAIAWYRADNYLEAERYLNEVLKKPETAENAPFQAQARLWKALTSKKMHKELKSQYWLKELLDHHPHSQESEWIDQTERPLR